MPRHARILLQGYPLHIVQRGHDRQACFFERYDCINYLESLRIHAETCRCSIHAYVLMTNHVHLLLSAEDVARIPQLMKAVAQKHAQLLNKRFGRIGPWWQGRFHSSPVLTDSYFMACHQYIELNPVDARMVGGVDRYPWSSYGGNAGLRENRLLTPHPIYLGLGGDKESRFHAYRDLFQHPLPMEEVAAIREAIAKNRALG